MDCLTPFFLCGSHCSGKTTILKDLYEEGVICERGSEIGKDLFYQRHIDTASQGEAFEIEITEMEIVRDKDYVKKHGVIGIESWHPGNLAYAMIRNPSSVPGLLQKIEKSPLFSYVFGIRLCVSWDNIFLRTQTFHDDRKWAADFYTQIGMHLEECLQSLGLAERCIVIDANRPYCDVYSDVKSTINEIKEKNNVKYLLQKK